MPQDDRDLPASAGVLLGLGLGGFFDGIVLHQILQWHHMVTSAGFFILWRHARGVHVRWSTRRLAGTLLLGWGIFNVVEGVIDHQLLGLHHVNETAPMAQWIYWDAGFLAWGAVMIGAGWALHRPQ